MNWTKHTSYVKIGFENRTNKSMFNEHNKKKYNDNDQQPQQQQKRIRTEIW